MPIKPTHSMDNFPMKNNNTIQKLMKINKQIFNTLERLNLSMKINGSVRNKEPMEITNLKRRMEISLGNIGYNNILANSIDTWRGLDLAEKHRISDGISNNFNYNISVNDITRGLQYVPDQSVT